MKKKFCAWCRVQLDPEKLRRKPSLKFCSHTCVDEHFREGGAYKELSRLGNLAQQKMKQETGHGPSYGTKKSTVAASNREKPRRSKKHEFSANSENSS